MSKTLTKVVCVGHLPYFGLHMPSSTDSLSVEHLEFYHGDSSTVFNLLERFKPQILFAFRPELIPASVLMAFSGLRIGFSSEIFPKLINFPSKIDPEHEGKLRFFLGSSINFYDYMFHYDAASQEYNESKGVFMSGYPPYPLNDKLFDDVNVEKDIDVLFIGRISKRRYQALEKIKRRKIRLVSIDHGLFGDDIINLLRRSKVVLNIHAEKHVSFEPRVLIGAAVGACVVTEEINIPQWLPDNPFQIINIDDENWIDKIDESLIRFDHSFVERQNFRNGLRSICSANKFLEDIINKARLGDVNRFQLIA
ncbi:MULTISPECIES: hypothetical protein [Methylobacterium]|uniref:hypothetical protein n=1 Tax=Methylobacterium TaxID=407 RepID=UPI0012E77491|nr:MULTISPECIES: hypothetical protein [Methylobacterium]MCI9882919.1 hypothetical protein [Methylobacterium goesingense]